MYACCLLTGQCFASVLLPPFHLEAPDVSRASKGSFLTSLTFPPGTYRNLNQQSPLICYRAGPGSLMPESIAT